MKARSRSPRWGGAVALLLAAAVIALAAGSAHAQTTTTTTTPTSTTTTTTTPTPTTSQKMVANTGLEGLIPGAAVISNRDFGQDFTSGSNTAGYTMTSVKISLKTDGDDIDPPTVRLVSGSVEATDGTDLTGPSSLTADSTALYEYTAPDATTLTSATQYWIVVEHVGDDVKLEMTNGYDQYEISAAEDTALEGWSIGNNIWTRDEASTGAFTYWGNRSDEPESAVLLEVHGNPIGGV